MKSPFWQFEDCELIGDFIDLNYCFISKEELESLPRDEVLVWEAKKRQVFRIIDMLFKDDSVPNWYLYDTGIILNSPDWKPLCASPNHSLRMKHYLTCIVIEIDWKSPLLRCRDYRYRFYFQDKEEQQISPVLLNTDTPKMAMLFIERIESVVLGSSLDDIREMVGLFFTTTVNEVLEDTGEIYLLNHPKNLLIEVESGFMFLIEQKEEINSYLTEPYQRDNIEVLHLIQEAFRYT
jgi:hypothetical protein